MAKTCSLPIPAPSQEYRFELQTNGKGNVELRMHRPGDDSRSYYAATVFMHDGKLCLYRHHSATGSYGQAGREHGDDNGCLVDANADSTLSQVGRWS